jgi:hypothetical protein
MKTENNNYIPELLDKYKNYSDKGTPKDVLPKTKKLDVWQIPTIDRKIQS